MLDIAVKCVRLPYFSMHCISQDEDVLLKAAERLLESFDFMLPEAGINPEKSVIAQPHLFRAIARDSASCSMLASACIHKQEDSGRAVPTQTLAFCTRLR